MMKSVYTLFIYRGQIYLKYRNVVKNIGEYIGNIRGFLEYRILTQNIGVI